MSFFAPINLLWLLPFVGTLLALYYLRPRRRILEVPSLLLWAGLAQSMRSDTPFQRLKLSLLLILQLLALLLLIFALGLPFSRPRDRAKSTYVIVLDQSAGMEATDVSPNRYVAAKKLAESFIQKNVNGANTAAIVSAGAEPSLVCGESSDRQKLIRAIEGTGPDDIQSDIPAALTFASSVARASSGVVLFTDGAWDSSIDSDLNARSLAPLHVVLVGTTNPVNIGITSISARNNELHSGQSPTLLVSLDRISAPSSTLSISLDGSLVANAKVPAGQGQITRVFSIGALRSGGLVTATVTGAARDDLAVDNHASLLLKPVGPVKVLLVTDKDPYLERALVLLPNVALYEVKPSDYIASSGQFDLVVYDNWLPQTLPTGPALVFNAISPDMPVLANGTPLSSEQIVDWDDSDPLLSYVDLSLTHVRSALDVKPTLWGSVVADFQLGPAIVKGNRNGRSIVWFGFSPGDSDLPVQIAFPILLSNIVENLTSSTFGVTEGRQTGSPLGLSPEGAPWRVTDPTGKSTTVSCVGSSPCIDTSTLKAGTYHAQGTDGQVVYALNLASDRETNIAVQAHPLLSPFTNGLVTHNQIRTNLSPWLALVALAVVLAEWLAYNRPLRYTKPT